MQWCQLLNLKTCESSKYIKFIDNIFSDIKAIRKHFQLIYAWKFCQWIVRLCPNRYQNIDSTVIRSGVALAYSEKWWIAVKWILEVLGSQFPFQEEKDLREWNRRIWLMPLFWKYLNEISGRNHQKNVRIELVFMFWFIWFILDLFIRSSKASVYLKQDTISDVLCVCARNSSIRRTIEIISLVVGRNVIWYDAKPRTKCASSFQKYQRMQLLKVDNGPVKRRVRQMNDIVTRFNNFDQLHPKIAKINLYYVDSLYVSDNFININALFMISNAIFVSNHKN